MNSANKHVDHFVLILHLLFNITYLTQQPSSSLNVSNQSVASLLFATVEKHNKLYFQLLQLHIHTIKY